MTKKNAKLTLKLDTIRVLSSVEMSQVVGGLAISPVQAARTNAHPTFVCAAKQFAAAINPAKLY